MLTRVMAGLLLCPWLVGHAAETQFGEWNKSKDAVVADRLAADIGAMWAQIKTEARVDESAEELGDEFSAEDDFGLAETKVMVMPELTLFPGKRHLIHLNGMTIKRSASTVLTRDILYSGDIYEAGRPVVSNLDLTFVGMTYGYQFIDRPRFNLAATVGIQIGDLKTNAEVVGEILREPTGDIAPVPVVGLESQAIFGRRWVVEARAQYSSISTADIEGKLLDARLAVLWQLNPHLGFGAGYRLFQLEVESFSDDSAGFVDMEFKAPLLFIRSSL